MKIVTILLFAATLALAGCGGEPLHSNKWQMPGDEIPAGPGLFSGEDGEFTIQSEYSAR
jgi:hypothetical protein